MRSARGIPYSWDMIARPCPVCRTPAPWEGNPSRPFCSERCRLRDLGAWSAEAYRIPVNPTDSQEEAWSEGAGHGHPPPPIL